MGKLNKTDREWQRELSPEEYRITRQKGTEPAFTGRYWNTKQEGTYVCRCCGEPLFTSETKYDSGCGWPSFYKAINGSAIEEHLDTSHGMVRTEIVCHDCDAHLGMFSLMDLSQLAYVIVCKLSFIRIKNPRKK